MRMPGIVIHLFVFMGVGIGVGVADEFVSADAMMPEHIRSAIAQLDDPSFHQRETAANDLFEMGLGAITPLKEAAEGLSPEASVRAFDVLVRCYRLEDPRTYEAAERALRGLMRANNLTVAGRAERAFDSITDVRKPRGVAKFKQLGGIIHVDDQNSTRQYILLDREWRGGDEGAKLIECVPQVQEGMLLVIIRGAKISDAAILDLSIELPKLAIQRRGPARLGVHSKERQEGCVIDGVDPGSAAERAGLQSEDRILEIDGQLIDDFKSLVEVIEKKEPGDRVPIVFNRDGKDRNTVAELLPWK